MTSLEYCDMTAESWNNGTKQRQLLLGNGTVNMFLQQQINMQQQRNYESDVFCVVHAEAI
jgi:hypothetical protein